MKLQMALAVTLLSVATCSLGAAPADQVAEIDKTLTPFGAIIAGNAEGSIPPYTGGLRQAPPGFSPDSGFWADPFQDEKPLLRINSKNMAQYADRLSGGQKMLLGKYPDYYLDIYPSHRTAAYPQAMLDATVRNASTCNTTQDNLAVDPACRGGLPFPLPQNGNEVIWNQQLRYKGAGYTTTASSNSWVVDSQGLGDQDGRVCHAGRGPLLSGHAGRPGSAVVLPGLGAGQLPGAQCRAVDYSGRLP